MFKYKTPSESTGFLLWKVTNLWQREIRKVLKQYNLTHTQFVVLASTVWLSKNKKNVTQVDIANQIEINKMMTSNVIRALEKNKLLTREAHQTDTRAKIIKPTEKGIALFKIAVKEVENFDTIFFDKLKIKEVFNNELIGLLEK